MYRFKPLESKLLHKTGYQNPLQGKKTQSCIKKNNIKAFITAASTCKRWTRANSAHMVLALKTFGLTGQRPTSSLQRETFYGTQTIGSAFSFSCATQVAVCMLNWQQYSCSHVCVCVHVCVMGTPD